MANLILAAFAAIYRAMERGGNDSGELRVFPAEGPALPAGAGGRARAPLTLPAERRESHERLEGRLDAGVLVLCDHASNFIPPEYDNLGLPPGELQRHIAWDIGAAGVARRLAAALAAPALLTRFSRLLVDPNRGLDDPTLVMRISDGSVIPGNARVDAEEKERRTARFWRPYDNAISAAVDAFLEAGIVPCVISVHSFTPAWRGVPRPWHAAVLYDRRDDGLARAVLEELQREPGLVIGDNEPYRGGLPGDTLDRHALRRGLPNVLVELRQDLVAEEEGQKAWAKRLEKALRAAMKRLGLPKRAIRKEGSDGSCG
jgi:predicted N-formylglutamate amidohydrolase